MAGYSQKTLVEKLGIKPGMKIIIINSPADYSQILGELPEKVVILKRLTGTLDFIHYFSESEADLETKFPGLKKCLAMNGTLWISWMKKQKGVVTDLDENIVRGIGLKNNLVDVKVCAVNERWSGLKFVYRVKDRV